MKKIVLLAFAIFAVGCSNDNNDDSVNKKMETDFEILISQSRYKSSEDKEYGWSEWEKDEEKFTWNSKSKKLTITDSEGGTTTYKNFVVDGLKIIFTYGIVPWEKWQQKPAERVFDFSDENTIREHYEHDKLEGTIGNWTVNRVSEDGEFRVKK